MFMFTIGNQPTVFLGMGMKYLAKMMDKRWKWDVSVTHVDTQKALDSIYLGPEMQMNMKYAAICTLIFVDMTYSATIPLFNIVTLMNLVLIYYR